MAKVVRFGVFEVDFSTGELRKQGVKLRVQKRSVQFLEALLERPGGLVTREELRQRLWPADVFVDFESGLNTTANRLRLALGDSAESPRYIETLARSGYRFIAPVEFGNGAVSIDRQGAPDGPAAVTIGPQEASVGAATQGTQPARQTRRVSWLVFAAVASLAIVALVSALAFRHPRETTFQFRQITFRHGQVWGARFAPDGHSVLYTASWDNGPRHLYQTNGYSPESRALGIDDARLVSVSRSGELALMSFDGTMPITGGTLARVAMNGGSPMTVDRNIMTADWSPDGARLAVVRATDGANVLEFPVGHIIHRTSGSISSIRVSPEGDRIAFVEHPVRHDNRGFVKVLDSGKTRTLGGEWANAGGVAWHAPSDEIWFTASQDGSPKSLWAATLSGNVRPLAQIAGAMTLRDVSADGRALATRDTELLEMAVVVDDQPEQRNISWLDWSRVADVSADGQLVLFDESGVAAGAHYQMYVRHMADDRTTRLGEGRAMALSGDGRFVLTLGVEERAKLKLEPLDGGTARDLPETGLEYQWARFLPGGQRLLTLANEPGKPLRLFVQPIDGRPQPITPPTVTRNVAISPDGNHVALLTAKGKLLIYSTAAQGEPQQVPTTESFAPLLWATDGWLYVQQVGAFTQIPTVIYRMRPTDGHIERWREIRPADPLGVNAITRIVLSADTRTIVFNYRRVTSELFTMEKR